VCNDRRGIIEFMLTSDNVDDRKPLKNKSSIEITNMLPNIDNKLSPTNVSYYLISTDLAIDSNSKINSRLFIDGAYVKPSITRRLLFSESSIT